MANPYSHPFLRKQNTMYLSTIGKQDFPAFKPLNRESTFLKNDIEGSQPRILIPKEAKKIQYSLSTYIEPIPHNSKSIVKKSNPLFIDDIQGCRTRIKQFRTKRVVNPLNPQYNLPSVEPLVLDKGRPFFRDTLEITDINDKKRVCKTQSSKQRVKVPIEGSNPSKLIKEINAISRLEVKDINKQQVFQSKRVTNPLAPDYYWRDTPQKTLNTFYGNIEGSKTHAIHPHIVNRPNNYCLGVKDIEGAQASSFFTRMHFIDKRREFRNYMQIHDIEKTAASSLKKGIVTKRQTNPLMPNYQFPGGKEVKS